MFEIRPGTKVVISFVTFLDKKNFDEQPVYLIDRFCLVKVCLRSVPFLRAFREPYAYHLLQLIPKLSFFFSLKVFKCSIVSVYFG